MRHSLEDFTGGVGIGSRVIANLKYSDGVVCIAGGMEELQELANRACTSSSQFGLSINRNTTKDTKLCRKPKNDKTIQFIAVNIKGIQKVKEFIYLVR